MNYAAWYNDGNVQMYSLYVAAMHIERSLKGFMSYPVEFAAWEDAGSPTKACSKLPRRTPIWSEMKGPSLWDTRALAMTGILCSLARMEGASPNWSCKHTLPSHLLLLAVRPVLIAFSRRDKQEDSCPVARREEFEYQMLEDWYLQTQRPSSRVFWSSLADLSIADLGSALTQCIATGLYKSVWNLTAVLWLLCQYPRLTSSISVLHRLSCGWPQASTCRWAYIESTATWIQGFMPYPDQSCFPLR